MAEAPERIWIDPANHKMSWTTCEQFETECGEIRYNRGDRYDRALSAAKEAAGELEALHKAKIIPRGSGEIMEMVKAEIEELEGE